MAAVSLITTSRPDILALQSFDYDHGGFALAALQDLLAEAGWPMPHHFARAPNSGVMSDHDLNGDGRTHDPQDAQSYGWFAGQDGMAVLSRTPFQADTAKSFTKLLWQDLDWARLPTKDGQVFPSAQAMAVQRLSSKAHWQVAVDGPHGPVTLLTSHHSTPVFDGPEDRNGLRNADELRLWHRQLEYLTGAFVLLGNFNLDPERGQGRHEVIQDLLSDPRLQDPRPASKDDPATARFGGAIGDLRVSYVLPARCIKVAQTGINWPDPPPKPDIRWSRHGLVWVDMDLKGCVTDGSGRKAFSAAN